MWIKDVDSNLVNLLNLNSILNRGYLVEGIINARHFFILYEGDNCQEYVAELEKELAAFGKLVKVEIPEPFVTVEVLDGKCTCGKGLHIDPPDHDPKCSFFVPF